MTKIEKLNLCARNLKVSETLARGRYDKLIELTTRIRNNTTKTERLRNEYLWTRIKELVEA